MREGIDSLGTSATDIARGDVLVVLSNFHPIEIKGSILGGASIRSVHDKKTMRSAQFLALVIN